MLLPYRYNFRPSLKKGLWASRGKKKEEDYGLLEYDAVHCAMYQAA